MMARSSELQAKRDRGDLGMAIGVGALATGFLVYDGIRRVAELFAVAGSITVQTPVRTQTVTTDIAGGMTATIDTATISVPDVNAVSVVSLVVGIVLSALGLMAATVLSTIVCRRLLRNAVFDKANIRLALAISMCLLATGLGGVWFRTMGLNGVFAAVDSEFNDPTVLFVEAAPVLVAAFAVGVLVIVFRRGAALQRETEGLV